MNVTKKECPCTLENYITTNYPLHSLNQGNIAQYSIVQHVTEINVHSLNSVTIPMLFNLVTVVYIATVHVFFAQQG